MANIRPERGAVTRSGWLAAVSLVLLGGLVAESIELLRIQSGGVAPPGWALRAALWVAYGIAAAALYGLALAVARRRAGAVAATALAWLVVLPWLNFSYLPRFGSASSLLGTGVAAVLLAVVVPLALRLPRVVAVAALLFGLIANGTGLWRGGGGGGEGVRQHAALPFNVVVVLIDTLRADHLGAYGYGRPTSPHFDALAGDSVLFDHTVAQAAWTKPSVASLMTGAFVHRHGVISSHDALGPELPTLAETLRRRGYRTAAFTSNPWITPEFRFDRGFDQFESGRAMSAQLTILYKLLKRVDRGFRKGGVPTDLASWAFWGTNGNLGNSQRDRLLTDTAVEWIRGQGGDPFFLYLHLIGPHDPYDPPAEYTRRFRPGAVNGAASRTVPPARVQTIFDQASPLPDAEREALIAQYDGAIAFADEQLGRIIDTLRETGKLDRTLLVVTADHGEEFYEHHNWRHGNQLYNEIVHVPLAFRLPGQLPPGRRSDLSMIVDIFPTVVALVDGQAPPAGLDGRALFADQQAVTAPTAYAEHWSFEGGTYFSKMVQRGDLKLNETRDEARSKERTELYNLTADVGEQRNLLENGEAVSENELGVLQSLLVRFGDKVSVASVAVDVDQSTKERLRQLGYVNE